LFVIAVQSVIISKMKKIVIGVLAHVDAGKTTLSEALMYSAGKLKKLGRVDNGDTLLDTHELEKKRGITIFAGQAHMEYGDMHAALLDTPGHVDFSAETERVLRVMDYAILVISGIDGVQAHTVTLWRLLAEYNIPVFVFVTKMDLARHEKEELLGELRHEFKSEFVDFTANGDERLEALAMCGEEAMESYLETGDISDDIISELIAARKAFPCYFGSGLKTEGIEDFLQGLSVYTLEKSYPSEFGARAYKISRDSQGNRLTHIKVTGGSLKVRDTLNYGDKQEKIAQIRIYNGSKYTTKDEVTAGEVCAIQGISEAADSQGFGYESMAEKPILEPVMQYRIVLPESCDVRNVFPKLKALEDEEPSLNITWNTYLQEVYVSLMGQVQAEILESLIKERIGIDAVIDSGRVLYKETIMNTVEGVGHYEPLRHYAEVHLVMKPAPRGSGIIIKTNCDFEMLDRNWQALILTHVAEKQHIGVLTGSPIADICITLTAGRAHLKHTEGGDFRQATYRAIRQGLMQAESALLEPYYSFRLEIPREHFGRADSDIRARYGEILSHEDNGENVILKGRAPVTTMNDYALKVAGYTGGRGRLICDIDGYDICHNAEEVIENCGYEAERDLDNTADSIFCEHGGGYAVKWNKVHEYMHVESTLAEKKAAAAPRQTRIDDAEVERIMTMTYGPAKDVSYLYSKPSERSYDTKSMLADLDPAENYLLVDGYNIIFAWEDLKAIAEDSIAMAREALIRLLVNYQAFKKCNLILVFDAYKVTGGREVVEKEGGIFIVYTREAEIADVYIERTVEKIGKRKGQIRVATSDGLEQLIILGKGALRLPARDFKDEVESAGNELRAIMDDMRKKGKGTYKVWEKLTKDN